MASITKDTIIGDILDMDQTTAPFFLEMGMHCLGCPSSRGETVEQACMVHGVDVDALLEKLVEEVKFRQVLYYRLNVIGLYIPPLRDRIEDLEGIAGSIIDELNAQLGKSVNGIDKGALEMLKQKGWQGNVRELRNSIERAMNFATGNIIHSEDFQWGWNGRPLNIKMPDLSETKGDRLIDRARDEAEREVIVKVLEHFDNNKSKAAEYLHIARPSLHKKMQRLVLD